MAPGRQHEQHAGDPRQVAKQVDPRHGALDQPLRGLVDAGVAAGDDAAVVKRRAARLGLRAVAAKQLVGAAGQRLLEELEDDPLPRIC